VALNLQDAFLSQLKKEGQVVTIFLSKGVQLRGVIRGYDSFTVFMEDQDNKLAMIYKHSITTVSPTRPTSDGFLREAFRDSMEKRSPMASMEGRSPL
jgi:host factor-I protein